MRARRGELQRTRALGTAQPAVVETVFEQRDCEGAGEVIAALGPVETGMRESAGCKRIGRQRDPQVVQLAPPRLAEREVAVLRRERAAREQAFKQRDAELACDVPVAGARRLQRLVGTALPLVGVRAALGDEGKRLQHMRDLVSGKPHIAVPALRTQHDQLGIEQLRDVRARGLCADAGRRRELAGGEELTAHQHRQHARAGRVADHRGDPGETGFG